MNVPYRIKIQTLLLSMIVLFISWVIGYIFLTNEFEDSLDKQFKTISESAHNILESEIKQERENLNYRLNKILNLDGLKQAIVDNDYKKIDLIINKNYLEVIDSEKHTDNIVIFSSDKKEIIFNTNKEILTNFIKVDKKNKSLDGFEINNSKVIYKVVNSIIYKDKFIGSIAIAVDVNKIIKNLNLLLGVQAGMVLDNENIQLLNSSDTLKYYFKFKKPDNFDFFHVNMEKELLNHYGETVAYLIVGYDMSDIVNNNQNVIYKMFFIGIFVAMLIVFIIYSGFASLLKYTTRQIFTDKLTGLSNREALNNDLTLNNSNILILSNIKEFSLLNRYYGLEIANEVLKQVAIGFKKFAIEHNMQVYRISADEYVLVSSDNRLGVVECADILEELNNYIGLMEIKLSENSESLKVEIYSGVSFNEKSLLEEAQVALKEAKVKSLPYLAYAQNLDNKVNTKLILDIKKTIKYAIEHKNIIPFFQPITNQYGEFIKYEALVRILDYENGNEKILFPDDFLPIAIKSGLYVDLAKEMLYQALTFFKDREEKISINFLPNDFYNHEIMDRFISLVQLYKHPERIVVEITEQEGVGDFDRLYKIVRKLRKLGVMIAIDDFGSGYANYVHVLKLKPDYLKIDGSLIKDILTDKDSQILVKSITQFAGYMNIKTIAEYVENEEIYELLKTYGVDEYQGYYFGRPLNLISGPNIF